ncbi:MAG: hypothetical protein ABIG71_04315 [Candidatus Uhrbacteria bacterium]
MWWILWGCDPVQWSDGIATLGYASLAMTLVVWLRTDDQFSAPSVSRNASSVKRPASGV